MCLQFKYPQAPVSENNPKHIYLSEDLLTSLVSTPSYCLRFFNNSCQWAMSLTHTQTHTLSNSPNLNQKPNPDPTRLLTPTLTPIP